MTSTGANAHVELGYLMDRAREDGSILRQGWLGWHDNHAVGQPYEQMSAQVLADCMGSDVIGRSTLDAFLQRAEELVNELFDARNAST